MASPETPQKERPIQQSADSSHAEAEGKSMTPPAFQLKTSESGVVQKKTMHGTEEMHHQIASDYRRWSGLDGEDQSEFGDGQITHSKALERPPMTEDEKAAALRSVVLGKTRNNGTLLQPGYASKVMGELDKHPTVKSVWDQILAEAGKEHFGSQMTLIENRAFQVVDKIEMVFIKDPDASSLDLLEPDKAKKYKDTKWTKNDYPGGDAGPNEHVANAMHNDLSKIRPERRANSTEDAVVSKAEYGKSKALQNHIESELKPVPDFDGPALGETDAPKQPKGHQLNRHALEDFLKLRADALKEGIKVIIVSSFRSAKQAAANAAASGNPSAVASYSSHSLGLAFDLQMSEGTKKFAETTTTPMTNVMGMRTTSVHKFMFMRGMNYGFYPYQAEPWHYEYNPPGFRESFMQEFKDGQAPKP